MPNLSPVPDCAEHLKAQLDAIDKSAVIEVIPYGAITVGEKGEELSDMERWRIRSAHSPMTAEACRTTA